MKKLFMGFLNVLIITILGSTFLYATENKRVMPKENKRNDEQIIEDKSFPSIDIVQKKLADYVSTYSLYPYILPGKVEMVIDFYLEDKVENKDLAMRFIQVSLYQEKKSIKGMFAVLTNKSTKENTIDLCYLTNDQLMSPTLFYDIMSFPGLFAAQPKAIDKFKEKGKVFVFIEFIKKFNNGRLQKWVFFNSDNTIAVNVRLTDDGIGGTFFDITESK
ncbi:MAG: hypothetical protein WCT85_05455 [Parachlamydiales bacterium]|jgi:hypothetical protein